MSFTKGEDMYIGYIGIYIFEGRKWRKTPKNLVEHLVGVDGICEKCQLE